MSRHDCPLRVAYLTGEYPKASHTFILREITALEELGAEVIPTSVRSGSAADLIGPEEEAEATRTFYVLAAAKNPLGLLRAHASLFARAPTTWLKTLGLAFKTGRPGFKGTLWQLFYFLEAGVLAHHLKEQGAAHLHNHFADSSANVAMLAAALADIPFSYTLHGPAELFEPESWKLREKTARASFVACISHFARSQAMLFSNPADWPKLRIIHCGVIPERYEVPPKSPSAQVDLLFVGRLTGIKGLRILFKALEQARKSHPELRLKLVGDGDDRAWAQAEATRLGGIELLGFQSQAEVAQHLAQADMLVLPSFAEGVPVVLMEAMAAARPVIATRVGGVSELVEDGISGLLVAPGEVDGLAQAIQSLADDSEKRARMGQAGQRMVQDQFDIRQEAARLLGLFQGTSNDAPRPDPVMDAS